MAERNTAAELRELVAALRALPATDGKMRQRIRVERAANTLAAKLGLGERFYVAVNAHSTWLAYRYSEREIARLVTPLQLARADADSNRERGRALLARMLCLRDAAYYPPPPLPPDGVGTLAVCYGVGISLSRDHAAD